VRRQRAQEVEDWKDEQHNRATQREREKVEWEGERERKRAEWKDEQRNWMAQREHERVEWRDEQRNMTIQRERERAEWEDERARKRAEWKDEREHERAEWEDERRHREKERARYDEEKRDAAERARMHLYWDPLRRADHCARFGAREYSARLWNVAEGYDWIKACERTPISIHQNVIASPDWCEIRVSILVSVSRTVFDAPEGWRLGALDRSFPGGRLRGSLE
jgi:hypothetical protein